MAAYAGLSERAGDKSGKFDQQRWEAAQYLVNVGSGTEREMGLLSGSPSSTAIEPSSQLSPGSYIDGDGNLNVEPPSGSLNGPPTLTDVATEEVGLPDAESVKLARLGAATANKVSAQVEREENEKAARRRPKAVAPSYLTKSQVSDLDKALSESEKRGASPEEQQGIVETFRMVANLQAALQPIDYSSAGARDKFTSLIDSDVKLGTGSQATRDAERLFSMHNSWARPSALGNFFSMVGEAGSAGPATPGGFATSAATAMGAGLISVLGTAEGPQPVGKSDSASHNDPAPLTHIVINGVPYPVYSQGDAAKLSPGKGMIFVEEGGDQRLRTGATSAAQDFDAGSPGAMSDKLTGRRIVPALRYTNDITSGLGVKRFDGYEGTHVLSLIDAKYNSDSMKEGRKSNLDMRRMISALEQNPSFKAILEAPTQARSLRLEQKLQQIFKIRPKGNPTVRTR
jgi:hypothetical protein